MASHAVGPPEAAHVLKTCELYDRLVAIQSIREAEALVGDICTADIPVGNKGWLVYSLLNPGMTNGELKRVLVLEYGSRGSGWTDEDMYDDLHLSTYYTIVPRYRGDPGYRADQTLQSKLDEAVIYGVSLHHLYRTMEDPFAAKERDSEYSLSDLYVRARRKADGESTRDGAPKDRPYVCSATAEEFGRLYEKLPTLETAEQKKGFALIVWASDLTHSEKAWLYFSLVSPGMNYADAAEVAGAPLAGTVTDSTAAYVPFDSGIHIYSKDGTVSKVGIALQKNLNEEKK